ncbi:hypothetical protein RvY_03764 [Ramazzottius varieornatus]|uniref:Uncharacterized protein n=1 Tax=Ramazzottius varieornatus TaxID=947166 RepID=A0A1D1UZD1_RAMVA|nr:hypothetical protein RvY_03764 [Ramazzottius varieornatus]
MAVLRPVWCILLITFSKALALTTQRQVDFIQFRTNRTVKPMDDMLMSASEKANMVTFIKEGLPAAIQEAQEELEPSASSNIQSRQNLCARMADIGKPEKVPMSVIRLNRFNWPRQASLDMAGSARIDELAMSKMMTKAGSGVDRNHLTAAMSQISARQGSPTGRFCLNRPQPPCDPSARYRSQDGWCNNLKLPFWGAALSPHIRVTPPRYDDGISTPRTLSVVTTSQGRPLLPNVREISTTLSQGLDRPHPTVTLLLMQFGQFLDHDFVNTPISLVQTTKGEASPPQCCNVQPQCRDAACFPIDIPANDRFYAQFNVKCMEFVRSLPAPRPDCTVGPRDPMNQNTHFIDMSQVYGSSVEDNAVLRAGERGGLRINTSPLAVEFRMMLLPPDKDTLDCQRLDESRACFKSGDNRVNIQTALTALHTIFLREHNRISDFFWNRRRDLPDEILYQETRKVMAAQWQAIVYGEFLPTLVGDRIAGDERNQIKLMARGFSNLYNENVNPGTWVETSTAAYRLHTLIQDWLPLKRTFNESFKPFHEFFFTPYYMYEPGALDNLAEGMIHENSQSFDNQVTTEMQEHLFQAVDEKFGLDIVSLNLQRGRDHGLATYNDIREFCGLPRARSFKDLEDVMTRNAITRLARVYRHVDDIDFWAGGVSENPVNRGDGVVGPSFACILTGQFRDWKVGDRFWYENPGQFTLPQLDEIKKASLAGIMCANTNIRQIQPRVFLDARDGVNPRVPCESIPQMDLSVFLSTFPGAGK